MPSIRAAILCGGAGARLWPLSRDHAPKQFHPLIGERSLLTDTVARAMELTNAVNPIIVTAEAFASEAFAHAVAGGASAPAVLLEPCARNTAPAAAFASLAALEDDRDAIIVLMPSDHHIADGPAFRRAIADAVTLAEQGMIVTLGIVPDQPNTGYGYIQRGQPNGPGYDVARFVEKPDLNTAVQFVASAEYYWNAGIFVFRAASFIAELREFRPDIAAAAELAWESSTAGLIGRVAGREAWQACASDSIDYAVAERTRRAAVIPAQIGWSDVGSWSLLMELAQRDANGNALFGSAWTMDSSGCYIRSTSRNVAVIGAKDMIVIETPDAVLIVHKDATQQVKQAAHQFRTASIIASAAE